MNRVITYEPKHKECLKNFGYCPVRNSKGELLDFSCLYVYSYLGKWNPKTQTLYSLFKSELSMSIIILN